MNQTTSTSTQPARRVASAPFQVSSVRHENRWLKMLVYGKPGAGKTTLLGSAADVPEMGRVFMINSEQGDMSLIDNPIIQNEEGIDVAYPTNYKTFVKMYEYISAHCVHRDIYLADPDSEAGKNAKKLLISHESVVWGIPVEEIEEPRIYRTVIIDSLSDIERMAMDNFLGAGDKIGMIDISEDVKVAEFKEYKQVNNTINRILRAFKYLKLHVLVVAGADYNQNELKQQVWQPALQGKLSTQAQGLFDIVGFLMPGRDGDRQIRRLWLSPDGKWDAKCRRAAIKDPFLDNTTMTDIVERCGLLPGNG